VHIFIGLEHDLAPKIGLKPPQTDQNPQDIPAKTLKIAKKYRF
jgi:hypothetical protein